ncbi:MAG: helix-turn-helix domain-containing protein, partial [Bacteroidota bacterium]
MTASDVPVSLRPTFYYRQAFPAGYRVPGDHRHASTEIMYVETGRCAFLAGAGPVTLGRGEFIFIPGGCAHGMEVRAAPCRIANLEFAAEAAAAGTGWVALLPEAASLLETAAGPFALRDDGAAVFQLLCGIIEELDFRRWGGEDLIRLRLGEMLIAVARLRRQLAEEASGSRHVRRAKEYLAEHYAGPVTVEEAARAIGVSRSHLQRLFHREVGITPNEYLTRIRLQHAKTLLARTDLPLVEVAARVGLESQQYLQNLFRRRVGMTPGRYRSSPAEVVTIEDKPCAPRAQARKTPAAQDARVGASEPMRRDEGMLKVLMLGAGSFFTSHLAKDIMLVPGLDQGEFALVDIDADRLQLAHALVEKVVKLTGKNWRVVSSTDRREVMAGADYIINTIEVSGVATVGFDYEIPKKYGIDQCIGDTIGPGGIMKALRTIPAWVGILRDAEELCPGALVLNYTNPMSMMTLAAAR